MYIVGFWKAKNGLKAPPMVGPSVSGHSIFTMKFWVTFDTNFRRYFFFFASDKMLKLYIYFKNFCYTTVIRVFSLKGNATITLKKWNTN